MQARLKPVPAYGEGAFAAPPHRLAPKRGVGSQFPQPLVTSPAGEELRLDELIGPGWCALATDRFAAEALAAAGLRALVAGRDFDDSEGAVAGWLERFDASWAVLRPDRFVFATGADAAAVPAALDELHRLLGRAAESTPLRIAEAGRVIVALDVERVSGAAHLEQLEVE